jgi:hypothetical protein
VKVVDSEFNIDEFLRRPLMASFTTLSESGPRETPVWFLWEDGALWIIASSGSGFPGRLAHDGRSAVGIVDFDLDRGFLQHLGLRGTACVVPMDASRRSRLVQRYLGCEDTWNPWFKHAVIERQNVLIRFVPETAVARDHSYFRHGDSSNKVRKAE